MNTEATSSPNLRSGPRPVLTDESTPFWISAHVLCAAQDVFALEYVPTFDALFEYPLTVSSEGTVAPSSRPGIGVTFRDDLIGPYRI